MKVSKILSAVILTGLVLVAILAFRGREANNNVLDKVTNGPATGFALIELFTSEGCSSCPPADDLAAKIVKEDKDKAVYVLGYHVDYWNHLGWRDEFSKAEYSERQRRYANWLHLDQVYTPQIVVNGKIEFVGSAEGTLRSTISTVLQKQTAEQLTLSDVQLSNTSLSLRYQLKGDANNRALLIAFVQKNAQSHVKSGENSGHTLTHVNIVRDLTTIELRKPTGTGNVRLPSGFDPHTWEVVSFVQNIATGEVLSAQRVTALGV